MCEYLIKIKEVIVKYREKLGEVVIVPEKSIFAYDLIIIRPETIFLVLRADYKFTYKQIMIGKK